MIVIIFLQDWPHEKTVTAEQNLPYLQPPVYMAQEMDKVLGTGKVLL